MIPATGTPSLSSAAIIQDMFIEEFLRNFSSSVEQLDLEELNNFVGALERTRSQGGRVFIAGVGGSAANASHMVNDLRKLADIEAYSLSDNVSELTARVNDDGWEGAYSSWLKASKFGAKDSLCVLSVGGGSVEKGISLNLIAAIDLAEEVGAKVFGVVGRKNGYLYKKGFLGVVLAGSVNGKFDTPVSETLQALVWHLAVTDPRIQKRPTTW